MTWLSATVLSLLGGCAALGWLRLSSECRSAPQVMLLLSAAGMVGGLWLDARAGGFAAAAALCLGKPLDLTAALWLHWQQLPMTHMGMIAGGLAAVPLLRGPGGGRRRLGARLAQNLICSGCMVSGMASGAWAFVQLAVAAGERTPAAMLGGMFGGMVWGMVTSALLSRTWIRIAAAAAEPARTRPTCKASRSAVQ